jgi:bis(5'-nucleosidyl)-tetraphosphatase
MPDQEIGMRRETHRAAGIVLYREEEGERRYLILRSALTRRLVWEFPKGGIEAGESEQQAAERELREETGVASGGYTMRPGFREEEHYLFTRSDGGERQLVVKRVVYFLAETRSDRVVISREATEFRWLSFPDARDLLRFPEKRRVLESAEKWLNLQCRRDERQEGEESGR